MISVCHRDNVADSSASDNNLNLLKQPCCCEGGIAAVARSFANDDAKRCLLCLPPHPFEH